LEHPVPQTADSYAADFADLVALLVAVLARASYVAALPHVYLIKTENGRTLLLNTSTSIPKRQVKDSEKKLAVSSSITMPL
jgi:hypothetical protein